MNSKISKIKSRWILDSRGNPTVETDVYSGNIMARAAVPSGASTGEEEALELRDGGQAFMGKGVIKAVQNVNDILAPKLEGFNVLEQKKIDNEMITLDGTDNKANLGANAILSVSLAVAKLAAKLSNRPLYDYLYHMTYKEDTHKFLLPCPMSNVLNGGEHAGGDLAIQEFMILPIGAKTFSQALQMISQTYHQMKKIIKQKYGASSINVGDEGGFAPNLRTTREALDVIIEAIEKGGYTPGLDFSLGMDAAASEFYDEDSQIYSIDGRKLGPKDLVDYYVEIIEDYPIISLEDPFDEKDFDGFAELTIKTRNIQIVDDDLTVTNVKRLEKAIKMRAGNSLLLKVNQIGTLTEAIAAANLSFKNGFTVVVSHRSGETCDNFIADLATGLCTGQIKTGAPCRSDRNAKYNRLLRIEEELGASANYPTDFQDYKNYIPSN
ncbi:MAG: phosphopyruvate hydratase [Candidatus Lokiarchaeota archaeon]|nr:phosphopyruvate hydratase [Candidatus Lokiarchaeota archaeon]